LHSKQNIESEPKWQTCFGAMPSKFSCLSGIGLNIRGTLKVKSAIDHFTSLEDALFESCLC
jgi:hypothetical protein